jgi:hypothetical protein
VGVGVAVALAISETRLAQRLGSDYAYYPAARNLDQVLRGIGSGINGVGSGCIALILLVGVVIPLVIFSFFAVPAIGFVIIGILHWRSWQKRQNQWITAHEAQRAQILGRAG